MLRRSNTVMVLKAITFSLHPSPVEGLFDHNLRGTFKRAKGVGEYETKAGEAKDVAESGPTAGGAKSQAMAKTIMSAFMSVLEFGAKKAEAKFEAKSSAASENRPMPETMTEANSAAKSQSISRTMPGVQSGAMSEAVSKTTMPAPKSQAMSEGQAEGNSGCSGDEGKALCSGGGGKVHAKRGGKKGGDKAAMNKIAGIDTTPALDSNRVSVAVNLMPVETGGVIVREHGNIPSERDDLKDIHDFLNSGLGRVILLIVSSVFVYLIISCICCIRQYNDPHVNQDKKCEDACLFSFGEYDRIESWHYYCIPKYKPIWECPPGCIRELCRKFCFCLGPRCPNSSCFQLRENSTKVPESIQ